MEAETKGSHFIRQSFSEDEESAQELFLGGTSTFSEQDSVLVTFKSLRQKNN